MLNRRFVPFFFDLSTRGAAGDADARKFVLAQRKDLAGRGVGTPPFLFMTPKGEVVGAAGPYDSPEKVLLALLAVLDKNPRFARMTTAEQKLPPLEKAKLLIDLHQLDKAKALLANEKGSEAHYLLGRLLRLEKKWTQMEEHFSRVTDEALADDVKMERAYRLWTDGKFEVLSKHLRTIPKKSNRYTEARYYEGLALYHQGNKDQAVALWKSTITGCSQDPWIYRADWAYTTTVQGPKQAFSTLGPKTSLLNRIGYMGRPNPDLTSNKK